MRPTCKDCGTRIERNGVCPNCDEPSYILDWQSEYMNQPVSDEFMKEASEGYERANKRMNEETPKRKEG